MIAPSHLVVGQFAYFCAAVVAGRYIASDLNNNELYILSGVGIALFLGLRLLMCKLK